jgi:AraC family transcriptional regulator of adaptative response / DNA-3-methyladenine glycosylase II
MSFFGLYMDRALRIVLSKMTMSEIGYFEGTKSGIVRGMQSLDPSVSYRALQTRDRRFDGHLFVGVTSTGIYCRPICPAKTAKFENCRFFRTAAGAQEAGFRACLRCRPEISPEMAGWRGTSNTVSRGVALIAEGFLDQADESVETLADRLGIGERHLRRLFEEHLGASPTTVAHTRRILFAKQLIHETRLSMSDVATASGFGSVRRFNDTFQKLYHRPPSQLRRASKHKSALPLHQSVSLHLAYQPPYDWNSFHAYLAARVIDGVEEVRDGVYRRTVSFEDSDGIVEVSDNPERDGLSVTIQLLSVRALSAVALRVRRMFDVYADVNSIGAHLSGDPAMARLVAKRPGLRAPGGWDGFELAVRAILGQQVTVEAGRQLAGKLVRVGGLQSTALSNERLRYVFPSAQRVALSDLSALGMPRSRKETIQSLARTVAANPRFFEVPGSCEEVITRLRGIQGIGDWTAQYIALRAFQQTDAFPVTDIGILRGAASLDGTTMSATQLLGRAEMWRPWRAYAAQHLWAADGGTRSSREESASRVGSVQSALPVKQLENLGARRPSKHVAMNHIRRTLWATSIK